MQKHVHGSVPKKKRETQFPKLRNVRVHQEMTSPSEELPRVVADWRNIIDSERGVERCERKDVRGRRGEDTPETVGPARATDRDVPAAGKSVLQTRAGFVVCPCPVRL